MRGRPGRGFLVGASPSALGFPLIIGNEGDIDAAANALAFAILALGLNIVVGFAGLLDLGYAAFFAIGAYTYGIFSSYQVQPEWWGFWEPLQWLGLVAAARGGRARARCISPSRSGSCCRSRARRGLLRRPVRRADAAAQRRLPRHRHLGFGEIVPIVARNTPYLTNGATG